MKPITKKVGKENENINKKEIVKEWLYYIYLFRKKIMDKFIVLLNPLYYEFLNIMIFVKIIIMK